MPTEQTCPCSRRRIGVSSHSRIIRDLLKGLIFENYLTDLRNDWPHPRRRLLGALPKSGEVGVASMPLPLLIAAAEAVTSPDATSSGATSVASNISDSPVDL